MRRNRLLGILLTFVIIMALSGCGTPEEIPPTATPTDTAEPIPPTQTPEPTPAAIPATQDPIQAGGFDFRVLRTAFGNVIGGMVPNAMGSGRILFLEFEMISGENMDFASLRPVVVLQSGETREPVAIISGGMVNTLVDMTYTGESGFYSPTEGAVVLAYVVPTDPGPVQVEFPSGEIIDMAPLMN